MISRAHMARPPYVKQMKSSNRLDQSSSTYDNVALEDFTEEIDERQGGQYDDDGQRIELHA